MEEAAGGKPGSKEEQSRPSNGVEAPAESAIDSYLRSQGLYRKRVAKDGSCLFRAVAEQVSHSQSQHLDIRMACINYLQKNREQFEAFIEGSFEEYLKSLENPQKWVGQVEISALSLMYKKDFILYQEPNSTPSYVTENGFPDKILLCFSNGSHYDIVYPIEYTVSSALCQSILYELLYEKVFDVDVSKILKELNHADVNKNCSGNSEESDSEDEDLESEEATSYMNGKKFQVHKRSHNAMALPGKVLHSLNPFIYQNIEYEDWHQSKRDQQRQDFSIAASMQYSVGDKCKVNLDHSGKYYNGQIQEVQSTHGPVIVFVEELGVKHSVQLKNLKPLPQEFPLESWSTVLGKKIKKSTIAHGQNVPTDADCKDSKNSNKPMKNASILPPRMQVKRQHYFSFSGMPSQQPSGQHKTQGRNLLQAVRRTDCEKMQELNHPYKEYNYFGLSPEKQNEKQAIDEVNLPYEIQFQDEEAFPALLNPLVSQVTTQTNETTGWQHLQVPNGKRIVSLKEQKLTRKNAETKNEKVSDPGEILTDQTLEPGKSTEPVSGVPPQIPMSSVIPTPAVGLDSTLGQAISTPVAGIPVTLQSVNQPLLPMPQMLNPYQDPLYPGFPLNEKGKQVLIPPYSLCGTGEDLPNDKNILRFFFNLGVKAYSCPMWAPHSYLFPLHQACMTACRMYPKVPVAMYSHSPWVQEVSLTQNGNKQIDGHFHVPNEVTMNEPSPQTDAMSSPAMPLFLPRTQVPESQGPICVEPEHPSQVLPAEYEESLGGKNIFPQPPFGQNPFLGSVPLTSLFPIFWYRYSVQGYVENSGLRQVVLPENKEADVLSEKSSPVPLIECVKSPQKTKDESDIQGLPPPKTATKNECNILNKTSARVSNDQQTSLAIPPPTQAKSLFQNLPPTETQEIKEQTVSTSKIEFKNAVFDNNGKSDKLNASVLVSGEESRIPKAREESSEDEHEVSDMFRSGRSKQFYNQTYGGGRRLRSERSYPGRGYQYPRSEEPWRGPPTRTRSEGSHYYRSFRGRPFRRRSNMRNGNRGQQLS